MQMVANTDSQFQETRTLQTVFTMHAISKPSSEIDKGPRSHVKG